MTVKQALLCFPAGNGAGGEPEGGAAGADLDN